MDGRHILWLHAFMKLIVKVIIILLINVTLAVYLSRLG